MATITLKGNSTQTVGDLPKTGEQLRDFTLVDDKLQEKSLADFAGKKIILNIFPSVDTGVCAAAARRFNVEAGKLKDVAVVNVSKDLPFALGRFCAAEGLEHVATLSDFRSDFGQKYGVEITDGPMKGLLSRAVIAADEQGRVLYTEQVPEITHEPNYEKALEAIK